MRDAAIAESLADFNAAISQINSQLAEAVTEVTVELNKALAEVDKNLNKSLAETAADMADAQDKAKKKLADTLEDIKKEYEKKLGEMEIKIASLIAKIAELQGAIAAASTLTIPSIPIPSVPIVPTPSSSRAVPADGSVASWRAGEQRTMSAFNITQNFTATKVDSYDVHSKTIAAIKLGSTVTVPSRTVMSQGSLRSRGID
jgi:ABC-type transporter Mla subunit MlaD